MKRIPRSFAILGHHIKVTIVPPSQWKHPDCVAFYDPERNQIKIKRRSAALNRQAFWHEATHAIFSAINSPLYSNERIVDTIGGALAQIMETAQ